MAKIKKNLSDSDMLGNSKEEITFEHVDRNSDDEQSVAKQSKGQSKGLDEGYMSRQAADHLNKALLEFKVSMFQKGILDYDFKISREENRIILAGVAKSKKPRS